MAEAVLFCVSELFSVSSRWKILGGEGCSGGEPLPYGLFPVLPP